MKSILTSNSFFTHWFLIMILCLSCSASSETENNDTFEEDQVTEQPDETDSPNDSLLNPTQATSGIVRNISATAFVNEMGIGWNLGNSMDVEDVDKTAWGNPLPTDAMIERIAERGFSTLRIPVTWSYHQSVGPDFMIESSFLDQVQGLVDKALNLGMHVIINTHHEDPWIIPTVDQSITVKPRLASLWTQVANRFKEYGDYLIFETLNEPRHEGTPEEWQGGTEEGRLTVNEYHKTALDAIRATGTNNTNRFVMISSYAASSLDLAMDALEIPNNDPNTIISIHSYFPFDFTLNNNGTSDWGTTTEREQLKSELERIHTKWVVEQQKPVILGEWGATFKSNNNTRAAYAKAYIEESIRLGMIPILWDNGLQNELGVFDRQNLNWNWHEEVVDIIIESSKQ